MSETKHKQRFDTIQTKTVETSRKLLDLIEQDPRDPESLRAMTWHVDQYWISGFDGPLIDQFHRSVDVLLRHYAEAEAVFARVAAEFADVMRPERCPDDEEFMTWVRPARLGGLAGEHLAVLRAVTIGRPAPDLTWTGADGRTTRLSEFRGTVVLLSFREVDEGPYENEPAHAARHAARLKGRPFTLVSVDAPHDPLRNRLGVGRSAAAILIDAAGRIRFQGPESRLLGNYIDTLVNEAEARK